MFFYTSRNQEFDITENKFLKLFTNSSLFRKFYLVTLCFEMISFLDIIFLGVRCIVLSWGSFILVYNFLINKNAFKVKHKNLLWCFIFVELLSSVVNMSNNFIPNLIFVYHSMICFFVFYGMYTETSHEIIEHEMTFCLNFLFAFSSFFSIISNLVLILKPQINIGLYYFGIHRNRLIGVYTNSNLLAFSMITGIVSADVLKDKYICDKQHANIFPKWCLSLFQFFNFFTLLLSDSNNAILFIAIYLALKIFYNNFLNAQNLHNINFIKSMIFLSVSSVCIMSISIFLRNACQDTIDFIVNDLQKVEEPITIDSQALPNNDSAIGEYITDIKIGRENYDVSSGRIILLKQGLTLLKLNPLIGISRANLVLYGKKYLKGGLIFSDLHNGYLTILVSYGEIGLIIFTIFLALCFTNIAKFLLNHRSKQYSNVIFKLTAILASYCVYSLFEKTILSEITFMVTYFWLILGYLTSYVMNQEK